MAQRIIVTELTQDNPDARLLDLIAAYFSACAETARLSDRYADVEKYGPYDREELAAFDAASRNDEQLADQIAACPAHTFKGLQAKAQAALAYWGDQATADNAIARALCEDLAQLWASNS